MVDFVSNEEIVIAARRNLNNAAWAYLAGGSESETTLRRNRAGFDRIAFRPRILRDVSKIDAATSFLGQRLRIPVMLAPIGSMQVFNPGGAAVSAEAAGEFGTVQVVSSVTEPSLDDTAAAGAGPKFFQLYVNGDMDWVKETLDRVKAAGYVALTITADTAIYSRRERAMLARYAPPTQQGPMAGVRRTFLSRLTWDTIDRIHEIWGTQPYMLKGVASAEDAELAVQHGIDVVWVSNHGGRQLDSGIGSIEALPEVVKAVNGRAEVMMDGGVQRATDVVKAIALGAKAVAIGKLQGWSMAAGGKDGIVRMLEIMEHEMISALGLLGITCVDEINDRYVTPAEPVTAPHEMSAWVNMPTPAGPGGRIL